VNFLKTRKIFDNLQIFQFTINDSGILLGEAPRAANCFFSKRAQTHLAKPPLSSQTSEK
jgi:hypothetical protein